MFVLFLNTCVNTMQLLQRQCYMGSSLVKGTVTVLTTSCWIFTCTFSNIWILHFSYKNTSVSEEFKDRDSFTSCGTVSLIYNVKTQANLVDGKTDTVHFNYTTHAVVDHFKSRITMTMAVKICKMYKKAEMLQPRSLMSTYIELVSLQRN